jgi:perosamine synthetase
MTTTGISPAIAPTRIYFPEEDIRPIQEAIAEILRTGQLVQGRHVRRFEEAFGAFIGAGLALATSSGTSALESILRGLGLAGRDVLVPVNTFIATVAAVINAGARPVPVDVDVRTASPTLDQFQQRRTAGTAAVITVHIGGMVSPEVNGIREWCAAERLLLVEDAAHAHGSGLDHMVAGTIGRAAAFSMFATKVMTTGEGGMVTTGDGDLAGRIGRLRDHGKIDTAHNVHDVVGHNWRMSEIHAVLGQFQLARLPSFLEARRQVASWYHDALRDRSDLTVLVPSGPCSWYKYIVLLPDGVEKPGVRARMAERGVHLAGEVYEVPLHRQPVFPQWAGESFPGAEAFARRHVCLPIHPLMTADDVARVTAVLAAALDHAEMRS